MKDNSSVKMTKSKKAILILVILNTALLVGLAVMEFVLAITSEYEQPPEPGFFTIDIRPLLLYFAGEFAALALIELPLGIFTFKGSKGAAIALLVFGVCVGSGGYLGVAAAIVALATRSKPQNNPDLI